MKKIAFILLVVVFTGSLVLSGCSHFFECGKTGLMTMDEKGTVTGKTRDIKKIHAMSQANLLDKIGDNPERFEKFPYDPTDRRKTRNTNRNSSSSNIGSFEDKILKAGQR